jgi:hypothetical protein
MRATQRRLLSSMLDIKLDRLERAEIRNLESDREFR